MKILVVDDDPELCRVLARFLQGQGHTVLTATDPVQGGEVLRQGGIQLVLTDLQMPYMDGLVLTELLAKDPAYASIPVILMSGLPEEEVQQKGLAKGAKFFLAKPISFPRLSELVKSLG